MSSTMNGAAQAALRARIAAGVARGRVAPPATLTALYFMASHLDRAAEALDGNAHQEAQAALNDASEIALLQPGTRFPTNFVDYITAPLTNGPLPMPSPLTPGTPAHVQEEVSLRQRLVAVHAQLAQARSVPATYAWLPSALALQRDLVKLAEVVHHTNATIPTTPPDTEPLPGTAPAIELDGLTTYSIGIIRLAETKGMRPTWGHPRGNSRRIVLNSAGPHGTFGSITVGRASGKVLRAEVIPGNGARPRRAQGTNNVRALINGISPSACSPGCAASDADACASRAYKK
ncbi:hypothetical protein ACIQU6_28010 [Streptomyces sp. NPDC090442]|uniref:hypothetical protein n=1 Tax=Streptomyces sp. NPDC090442 TaxID=3365962 RepID=UPI003817CAA0